MMMLLLFVCLLMICIFLVVVGSVTCNNQQLYMKKPSKVQNVWRIYGSMLEIWMLLEALDERGVRISTL